MLLLLSAVSAFGHTPVCGQAAADTVKQIVILFPFESSAVDSGFMDNAQSLHALHVIMSDRESLSGLDSVVITGFTSPDGSPWYNRLISERRAHSLKDYILANYPFVDSSICSAGADPGYWDGLIEAVGRDPDVPARDQLLKMIADPGLSDHAKSQRMAAMHGGKTFAYLRDSYTLRRLRQGAVLMMFFRPALQQPVAEPAAGPELQPQPQPQPELPESIPQPQPEPPAEPVTDAGYPETAAALRTNLLADVMGAPNLGVEVPLGDHFSAAADFAYGYTRIKKVYALQTIQGTLEGRYWFKPGKNVLTGWNLGVYGTYCSRFDLRMGGGWQGDGYWSAGLTGGYAIPLTHNLNLDLSIAGGYFYSPEIRQYDKARNGHLQWEKTMYNVSRVALTQVRVDLVWLINKKAKR